MTPQTPAEGILLQRDWGKSKMYYVACECTDDDHSHVIDVEADESCVTVTTYTTQKTDHWSEAFITRYNIENSFLQEAHWRVSHLINGLATRLKLTWILWTQGYVEYQASLIMTEQQALNYANVLTSAVEDVKMFKQS
jgi:hypothetical protein